MRLRLAILINANVLLVPIVGLRLTIASSIWIEFTVMRHLKHDGSHHFVIFVIEDMTMVDITWELPKLVTGNMEKIAFLSVLFSEIGFGPSDTILKSFERHNPGSIFPSGIVRIL